MPVEVIETDAIDLPGAFCPLDLMLAPNADAQPKPRLPELSRKVVTCLDGRVHFL